ncbi:MAG: hypothetical protein QOJ46_1392 [bacterium]
MPNHDALLRRHQPVLRYDSNEQFFADSAEQYMLNPGNELRRQRGPAGNGAVLARAQPKDGQQALTLDFLRPKTYADGTPVEKTDLISVDGRNYREQYVRMRHDHPELNNVVYAHAIEANGRLWLQYWFWYFYNDYQLSFGAGTHEGDWEMVQYRMDEEAEHPDIAVYTQHSYGEMRRWAQIEKFESDPNRPIVYVARGSHAGYFEAGFHQTEAWYDLADGKRRMKHRPRLQILGTDEPAWPHWPGRWGDTVPSKGAAGAIQSNSPTGPAAKKQWTDPDKLLDNPPPVSKRAKTGAAAPEVTILRAGGRLRCEYDVTTRDPRPAKLVVTVNSSDEPDVPPRTHTIDVHPDGRRKVTTDIVLDPVKHYDVYTSTVAGDPPQPSESTLTVITPYDEAPLELPPAKRLLKFLSSLIAWLRGDRRRATRPHF